MDGNNDFIMTVHNDSFMLNDYNNFLMTGQNDSYAMTDYNDRFLITGHNNVS